MGLEWHNRHRNNKGQFSPRLHVTQVHVYCTWQEWKVIKAAAMLAMEDLSEFCRNAAIARAAQVKRQNEGIQIIEEKRETQPENGQIRGTNGATDAPRP